MFRQFISLISIVTLIVLAGAVHVHGQPFSLLPTFDVEIGNDAQIGPGDASETGSGMAMRNIGGRRRVSYVVYDISTVRSAGQIFKNVSFSNYGHDTGLVDVYGVLEAHEHLVASGINWNNAPGVKNDPTPPLDSEVALDLADVTDVLMSFDAPARGTRASTETSQALADWLSTDTNGIVALMFAPNGSANAIVRTVDMGENGGTILEGEVGGMPTAARGPSPEDGAVDVRRDVVLSWVAGTFAAGHDVYLGTSFEDVSAAEADNPLNVLVSPYQSDNTYAPATPLAVGQTYYWRIDEVNAPPDSTVYRGDVWSFTVEPYSYPLTNITATASSSNPGTAPEKTIDGSGLNDADQHSMELMDTWLSARNMPQPVWIQYEFDAVYKLDELWVWNSNQMLESTYGFGVKDVTVECSEDGENWTTFGDLEFAQAPGSATYTPETIDLGGAVAKFVKLTVKSNWGGILDQYGLAEVRFFYVPVRPREPKPADGATDPAIDAMLSWRPGREAVTHEVRFGDDQQAVADGTVPAETVSGTSYDPGLMAFGTTYYWKVAEANEAETPSVWESDLWSFATAEYAVVDDFESYTDDIEAGTTIWQTWLDGLTNNTGSTVGYWEAPFAEQTIVHGGSQSMPLDYNNVNPPYYSEAERSFDPPQDWTISGADTLSLYVRGNPVGFEETPDGAVTMSAAGTDIFGTADEFRFAYKPLTGDVTIVARVDRIDDTDPWAKAGVMVRETLDPGARWAAVFATPGNGVRFQARALAAGEATSDTSVATPEQIALQVPVWIKLERSGSDFSCFYSTDGVAWTAMSWNPQAVSMSGTIYVGLAVTSHSPNVYTIAEYSNISAPGVAGPWQVAEIGVAQPANDPSQFYVVVQDSSNKSAMAVHPDPAITNVAEWTQWQIPLSSLTGVNLRRVEKIYLGVGDRDNPQPDGAGLLYIDDIGFGHPAAGSE